MKTEILRVTDRKAAARSTEVLADGGLIIYPTETVYGIGADATSDKAVKKVIAVKKRSPAKHIIVAVSDIKMARKYAIITKKVELLAKAFMPGPLTLILESKEPARNAVRKKIRFRIPDNKFVLSAIRKLGKPITTTSANISGGENLYKISDIIKTFDGRVDLIIDAGNIPKRKPSTVFDTIDMKVVRPGPISEKQILAALKTISS
ncbi:MAG: tRNA threonylcarbamoyladenosine biosynthesis protein [archaeon GW2011_AR5]|nr:MAG: tRNA threonylcarbamoyladenosine biosynthesis protein [archaeon GW2011_AR5]